MSHYDTQSIEPIAYCSYCNGEIYDNDIICNLEEVYEDGRYVVHEECIIQSLQDNKELVLEYIFDDLCRLQDVFNELLAKYAAWDFFYDWSENNEQ